MNLLHFSLSLGCAVLLTAPAPVICAATNDSIDFKELYDLLRTNLAGADEAALNAAAARGLLDQLKPRVTLVKSESVTANTNAPLAGSSVYDGAYAYLRVARVDADVDKQLWKAYTEIASSNRLRGVLLDLRFAEGQDYAAAAAAANHFFTEEKPLLDWGQGQKSSTTKTDAMAGPVAVLVNQKTGGAAEALAAVLRQHDVALLLGAPTAGTASIGKEFALKTGPRVRIAISPIKVAKDTLLSTTGLQPDIRVDVAAEDERAWYKDAYSVLTPPGIGPPGITGGTNETSLAGTNRSPRRRYNEADLVRLLREGQSLDGEVTNVASREVEPARAVLRDPVLVRALDLLKALAVVKKISAELRTSTRTPQRAQADV